MPACFWCSICTGTPSSSSRWAMPRQLRGCSSSTFWFSPCSSCGRHAPGCITREPSEGASDDNSSGKPFVQSIQRAVEAVSDLRRAHHGRGGRRHSVCVDAFHIAQDAAAGVYISAGVDPRSNRVVELPRSAILTAIWPLVSEQPRDRAGIDLWHGGLVQHGRVSLCAPALAGPRPLLP